MVLQQEKPLPLQTHAHIIRHPLAILSIGDKWSYGDNQLGIWILVEREIVKRIFRPKNDIIRSEWNLGDDEC